MPSSTHQRQPKLRDSCDHCSNSKVRCDKSKPSCLRCREKGFECEYSPARRIGRIRSKTLKNINDDVKFRLPKGDVPSASSSPPELTEEMESPPLYSSSPEEWSDSWATSPPMPFWQKQDPFAVPQQQQHGLPFEACQAFSPTNLDQTLVPTTCILPQLVREGAYIPLAAPTTDNPFGANASMPAPTPQMQDIPMPTMEQSPPQAHRSSTSSADIPELQPSTSGTSSSSSSGGKQIDDDFNNLITFADSIENKFDVFVRRRLSQQAEGEGEPDPGETNFYYSLAELKRRLKWLREDVRNS